MEQEQRRTHEIAEALRERVKALERNRTETEQQLDWLEHHVNDLRVQLKLTWIIGLVVVVLLATLK